MSEDRLVLRYSIPAYQVASHYGLSTSRLADLNRHWMGSAQEGRADLPSGSTVWLPGGTLARVASAPVPTRVMVAKNERKAESTRQNVVEAKSGSKPLRVASAELKPKSKKVAISDSKPKPIKVARVEAKLKPRRTEKRKARSFGGAKVHVVKANETLYRVATYYELSVEQLRRLNRMGPKDTHIRPGQRLRVSG